MKDDDQPWGRRRSRTTSLLAYRREVQDRRDATNSRELVHSVNLISAMSDVSPRFDGFILYIFAEGRLRSFRD
mgnify:CR=1 FL=1